MERNDYVKRIQEIIGNDLRELADLYNVTVFLQGNKNKGWAGHSFLNRFSSKS